MDICQVNCVHPERVAAARQGMSAEPDLATLAELFRLLGDGGRLRLVQALAVTEMCVCDLAAALAMSPSAVSHQLRLLRTAQLVRCRREGKMAFYSLVDDNLASLVAAGTLVAGRAADR